MMIFNGYNYGLTERSIVGPVLLIFFILSFIQQIPIVIDMKIIICPSTITCLSIPHKFDQRRFEI